MNWDNHIPLHVQIAELVQKQILQQKYKQGERIPSVREMAMSVEVNPNTVAKSYEILADKGVIQIQRGQGYFVHSNAIILLKEELKKQFLTQQLEEFFKTIRLLDISFVEINTLYQSYLQKHTL